MHRTSAGFTLVELIVVVILIGVMAGLIVVRLGDNRSRRADVTLTGVAALLETLAHRQTVSSVPVRLQWDPDRRQLWMDVLRRPSVQEANEVAPEWVRDPLVRPVTFPDDVELESIALERRTVEDYPIIFTSDVPRPTIEVFVSFGGVIEVVELLPFALEPTIYTGRRVDGPGGSGRSEDRPVPVDLDATGQRESDW